MEKIFSETELMKDGLLSIFSFIIFLKKLICAETNQKFQQMAKREGMGLFRVYDPGNYKRKKRSYSDKEKNLYAKTINKIIAGVHYYGSRIPIDSNINDLYYKVQDGIILLNYWSNLNLILLIWTK